MDTNMFAITMILMMIFLQYGQHWLVFGILILGILSARSFATSLVLLLAAFVLYATRDILSDSWPIVAIALIALSLFLSSKTEREEQSYGFESLFGGMQ